MRLSGPWTTEHIHQFLAASIIPMRLGLLADGGGPLVLSLWYLQEADALWCATPKKAHAAALLRRNPRCAFEIAADQPPYKGVRGQGDATLHDDRGPEILSRLLQRYAIGDTSKLGRMLIKRSADETAICIRPHRMTSWDFTERMSG